MFAKSAVLFVALYLLQGINCETVEEVVKEFQPKITALKGEIQLALKRSQSEINAAVLTINSKIIARRNATIVQRDAAVERVNRTLQDAEASGKNVSECRSAFAEALRKANVEEILKCHVNEELIAAQVAVVKIAGLLKTADELIATCVEQFPEDQQAKQLRRCLNAGLVKARVEIKVTEGAINLGLKGAVPKAEKCAVETGEAIAKRIEVAEADLNKCVESTELRTFLC